MIEKKVEIVFTKSNPLFRNGCYEFRYPTLYGDYYVDDVCSEIDQKLIEYYSNNGWQVIYYS